MLTNRHGLVDKESSAIGQRVFLPINFTLPLLFFVLWSSALVTEKIIFVDVSTSATLALFLGAVNFGSSVLSS